MGVGQNPTLSIVVIGKNAAHNLPRVFNSLKPLAEIVDTETIYVDSSSTDSSIEVAKVFSSKVLRLAESKNLSASAGRYVGTLVACGAWILYLDEDMELTPKFCELIGLFIDPKSREPKVCGYIGRYDSYYNDGSIRRNQERQNVKQRQAKCIGGGVLLLREAVLAAGNWDYRVFSNEELDLYTRLRNIGYYIKYINVLMLVHHTQRCPRAKLLLGLFVPTSTVGNKYFGIGQIIRSRARKGSLLSFVRFFPYPFVYLGLLLLGILWGCIATPFQELSILFFLSALLYVILTKGATFLIVYLAFIPQACIGFFRYPCSWEPSYEEV